MEPPAVLNVPAQEEELKEYSLPIQITPFKALCELLHLSPTTLFFLAVNKFSGAGSSKARKKTPPALLFLAPAPTPSPSVLLVFAASATTTASATALASATTAAAFGLLLGVVLLDLFVDDA